jgi:transposase
MSTDGTGDLDDRIAAAFADTAKSGVIAALIAEAEGAALASSEAAERAKQRALDPVLAANAIAEAKCEMDNARFRCERLQTAVVRLRERLKEVRTCEENERRWTVYEALKAERDRLAAEGDISKH